MDDRSKSLAAENFFFAIHIAKEYLWTGFELDELVSICTFALCKAAASFDVSKGAKFSTYAARIMRTDIFLTHRESKTRKFEKRFGKIRSIHDQVDTKYENLIIQDQIGKVDYSYDVIDAVNSIDKNRKIEARVLYHFYGYSQKEIGLKFGVDKSRISRILKEPIEKGSVVV